MCRIITISKLNADRSDEHHLKVNESCNKAIEAKTENAADNQKLQELIKLAEERCPAMYSIMHEVKVNTRICT